MSAYRSRDRRCPRCGTQVAQQARSCLLCGYRLDRGGYAAPLVALIGVAAITGVAIGVLRDRSGQADSTAPAARTAAVTRVHTTIATSGAAITLAATPGASPTMTPEVPTEAAAEEATAPPADTATPEPTVTETPVPTDTPEPTPTSGPIIHTVASGDTLLSIANQYGSTVDQITAANGIGERSLLSIGQELIVPIPEGGSPPAADEPTAAATLAPQFIVHVVEAGDTLLYLAGKYDTTVAEIVAANEGMTERTILSIGQQVRVPVTTPAPEAEGAATPEAAAEDAAATDQASTEATAVTEAAVTATTSLMSLGGAAQPSTLALLSPAVGAKLETSALLLSWTGVGELAPDLWYVVNVWPVNQYDSKVIGWTRANSWQPSAEEIASWGANPHLMWNVGIERETSDASASNPTFEPAGPRTEPNDFYLVTG